MRIFRPPPLRMVRTPRITHELSHPLVASPVPMARPALGDHQFRCPPSGSEPFNCPPQTSIAVRLALGPFADADIAVARPPGGLRFSAQRVVSPLSARARNGRL